MGVCAGFTFFNWCDLVADQLTRLVDASRDHSRDGARRHGDGQSNVVGVVHWRDFGHRDRLWCAADCYVGARHVRRMSDVNHMNQGLTADALFVGATRPPMRWGVTYSALLFNMVFTLE